MARIKNPRSSHHLIIQNHSKSAFWNHSFTSKWLNQNHHQNSLDANNMHPAPLKSAFRVSCSCRARSCGMTIPSPQKSRRWNHICGTIQLGCFILVGWNLSWFIMIYHGLSWFIMIYHGLSWFIMVYHDLSWFIYLDPLTMAPCHTSSAFLFCWAPKK